MSLSDESSAALWQACLDVMAQEVPAQQFATWLQPLQLQPRPAAEQLHPWLDGANECHCQHVTSDKIWHKLGVIWGGHRRQHRGGVSIISITGRNVAGG